MLNQDQVHEVIGTDAFGHDGEKVGKVAQVYIDSTTQQPAFATVHTGLFGTKESLVPIDDASFDGNRLLVTYTKDKVKDAPRIDHDGAITPDEAQELYRHYGLTYGGPNDPGQRAGHARDASVAGTPDAAASDATMTRSEEELQVGTREEEAGRVRMRKHVTTENVTTTVPVREEHAVIEREPIAGRGRDATVGDGAAITEGEQEITLHKEVPVVGKTTTAKERVRLATETTVGEETVSEQVRKEHIDVDGDVEERR